MIRSKPRGHAVHDAGVVKAGFSQQQCAVAMVYKPVR
jgi:hypothetical protein